VTAPLVIDGPMDGVIFLAYVRDFLCPTLQPGDQVIADNLSSHKVAGVREAIEAVARVSAICRRTHRISTPSKSSSPNSRRSCAKPPSEPSMRSGTTSEYCSISSPQRSAPTISAPQDMYVLKSKIL